MVAPVIKKKQVVDTISKLMKLARRMQTIDEFAFDTETNGLRANGPNESFMCVGISISWNDYDNYYIPLHHRRHEDIHRNIPERKLRKYLMPIFARSDIRIVGQNVKFDLHVISRLGFVINTTDIFDTMIASWLCNENEPNGLKENTQLVFGIDQTHFKEVTSLVPKEVKKEFGYKANQKVTFDLVLIDEGSPYAIDDSFYTWNLYLYFLDRLEEEGMSKIYFKHYAKFLLTLFRMEEHGAVIDAERLREMDSEITKDTDDLLYELKDLAGVDFNPGSTVQLAELLFGYVPSKKTDKEPDYNSSLIENSFNFKVISRTKTGAPQSNFATLHKLAKQSFKNKRKNEGVEFCKKLMEYKKLAKLKDAFITGMSDHIYDDGRVHPNFNIIGADSGRISCSTPNLQQLPKAEEEDKYQIRSLFIGGDYLEDDDGNYVCEMKDATPTDLAYCNVKHKKIVAGDFSNLEMRVLAHFSEDKNLLEMFANDADTHGATAVNMFELDCDPSEVKKKYPHLRQAAKVINFLLMYGGGAYTLYNNLKEDPWSPIDLGEPEYLEKYHVKSGEDVAQIYIDKYFSSYSGVAQFIKQQKRYAHKYGFVNTLMRRKRRLPDIASQDFKQVAYCERLSVNACIQGSAADITSSAQNLVDADPWYREHGAIMIVQVHDELVFECPEQYVEECIRKTKAYMEHPFGPNVELNLKMRADFDAGDSYQQAK